MDKHKVIDHFRKYIEIDYEEETEILRLFTSKLFTKREIIQEPDKRCKYHFFVVEGCLRMFFTNDRGIEQTIQFALENWWLTDYTAFETQTNANFSIQAVERAHILALSYQEQDQLLKKFPKLERYFRLLYQKAYAASQFRIKYLFDFSREEIYHHFNDNFPEFANRVPQHLLASYLNMTPEYLSEIKAKKRSR